jgi:hypothetical protein
VILFSQTSLVGVDAANGQLLWRTPFEGAGDDQRDHAARLRRAER